jgi:undecaprenyl diphosphate synthase
MHLGLILDGNRRFAAARKMPKFWGHKKGVENLEKILKICAADSRIKFVTAFALSTENLKRDEKELKNLFLLLQKFASKISDFKKFGIRFSAVGNLKLLPAEVQKTLENAKRETRNCGNLNFAAAVAHGGRDEILRVFSRFLEKTKCHPGKFPEEIYPGSRAKTQIQKEMGNCRRFRIESGMTNLEKLDLTEKNFAEFLDAPEFPDLDLIIRTGGKSRLSNFQIWRAAYAELFFSEKMWPEFSETDLNSAIDFFENSERNFGA